MVTMNILVTLKYETSVNYLILLESLIHTNDVEKIYLYIIGEETNVEYYKDIYNLLKSNDIQYQYFQFPKYNLRKIDDAEIAVLFSPYLLPEGVNKVIYFNANLIIKGRLTKLWELNVEKFLLAACEDRWISRGVDADELQKVKKTEKEVYFNCDVLVMNLWAIKNRFQNKLFAFIESKNIDELSYGLKSFLNRYLTEHILEIKEKKFNTQLMSYRDYTRKIYFEEAVIINYGKNDIFNCDIKDIYEEVYSLWWDYASLHKMKNAKMKRNIFLRKSREKCSFMFSYFCFALRKLFNKELSFQLSWIELLMKSDLWDPFYFLRKNRIEYEKKYKEKIKNYKSVQVHRMANSAAGIFFLGIICYKILKNDKDVLHILIPNTMLADSSADNPDFNVHNEYALRYFEDAYIPRKEEKGFLRYILSRHFYDIDFALFNKFVPSYYEGTGELYEKIQNREIIKFDENEKREGEGFFQKYNIKKRYVCIAPRNSAYKKTYLKTVGVNDYLSYRNGSIESYLKAVELIKSEGFDLIQMGKVNPISFPEEYGILNFSQVYNEFMDIYLFGNCQFFIGDSSGTKSIADVFSKPSIQANLELITTSQEMMGYIEEGKDLILPVKLWDEREKRYLTLKEHLALEVHFRDVRFEEKIIESGYKPVAVSAEELEMAAREMIDNLLGNKEYTEEERELQSISRKLIRTSAQRHGMRYPKCNIAIGFLKMNPWYLE